MRSYLILFSTRPEAAGQRGGGGIQPQATKLLRPSKARPEKPQVNQPLGTFLCPPLFALVHRHPT